MRDLGNLYIIREAKVLDDFSSKAFLNVSKLMR